MAGQPPAAETFEYVVVGSGAGGGPLAANLARAGKRVLLLEAGGDDDNANYQVPCFHALATEDPALRWDYFVHHYSDGDRERLDSKFVDDQGGVLYPRAGTLGGCTAHNAMITVCPHNADWDAIARATGDRSWSSRRMRRYFQRLERCAYKNRPRAYPHNDVLKAIVQRIPLVDGLFRNRARHGFDGWLGTDLPPLGLLFKDDQLLRTVVGAALRALERDLARPLKLIETLKRFRDPNDWRVQRRGTQGLWLAPIATTGGHRNGAREYLLATAGQHPDRLVIRTGALATRVLLDDANRATGVEYVQGSHLYRADPSANGAAPREPRRAAVSAEVILSAGAFNTPQLLKLSGIGPAGELAQHGIDQRVDLPGVGENLQDRYEVGVVTEMAEDFSLLRDATWRAPSDGEEPDSCYADWLDGKGVYTTNGVALGVVRKSPQAQDLPDLFVFGIPSYFRGYFPHYSELITQRRNVFTWAILKAYTNNTAGSVRLRSADPREPPDVQFRYFDEGSDANGDDLDAVVDGVRFARSLMAEMSAHAVAELVPGTDVTSDDDLREFVRNEAWGHHASCTCKIGPRSDPMAVVDSDFRVHGTTGLRVVDASVFPRIPGFFIVTAVYMISEKASDVILGHR